MSRKTVNSKSARTSRAKKPGPKSRRSDGRPRRKRATGQGRLSSDELANIFGGITSLIHVVDPATLEVLYVNGPVREKVGDVEGEKCYFALHGRGSQCPTCSAGKLTVPDAPPSVVEEWYNDAEKTWFRHDVSLIDWPDGRRVMLQIATDITEQKNAEQALKESEEQYRQVLVNAQEGIAIIQDGRFRFFNPKFPEVIGRPPIELQNVPFLDLLHPDDKSIVVDRYQRRVRGEAVPSSYDFRILNVDGSVRWLEINAVLFQWDGRNATLNFVTDITARKLAEEELRSRESLFRSTIESTGDGILVVDKNMKVTHANARYAEMWNVPPDLLRTRDVTLLRAHALEQLVDPEGFVERTQPLYESAELSTDILEFKDGRIFDRYSAPLTQGDELVGRVWGFRDVTEQREAESALREKEERLRLVFETAKDAIFVLNAGVFVECNTMAIEMFGATRDEIIGHPPDVLFPPTQPDGRQSLDLAGELIDSCLAGEPQFTEWVHRRFNGKDFFSEVTLDSFEMAGERYVQAIVKDVTARKRAEEVRDVLFQISQAVNELPGLPELLRRVHEQLGRLIDTTNYYVALYDEASDTYTFPYHVDEVDELDEITPLCLKKSLTDYVRRTGRPILVTDDVHRKLEQAGEVELVGVNSPIWLGVPLKVGQRVIGVVVVQSYRESSLYSDRDLDIMTFVSDNIAVAIERVRAQDERRMLQSQIEHAQKLESLGVLAGGIAHDFNNLLTGILGNADLALLDVEPGAPASDCLVEIRSAAQRAADLSRQMLAYSGKGSFVIEPIDVNDVIREMGSLLEVSISKKANLVYDLADDLPAIVGDATQLRQVIMNLITNASDALGDDEGTISISSGAVECDRAYLAECYLVEDVSEGSFVRLRISDTGCGMDEETLQRIFDPFFTTKFTGRGLGLASTLGIIRGHKGAVHVESEAGAGTTFEILLPAGEVEPVVESAPKAEARSWTGDATVLVVDDEEAVRDVAGRMLEQAGLSVVEAADGVEAVAYFREHSDDVGCVLLDLTMPHMSGEETLVELRRIRDDVRVVLSSGYSEQEVAGRFRDAGSLGFVQKPYLVDALVGKIGEALAGQAERPV